MYRSLRCLVIDNYDSFTWNLVDYISQVFQNEPIVVRNNTYTWKEIRREYQFDCVIVSPGPGSPEHVDDFHVSAEALKQNDFPVLGVCLGFQGLAHIFGGRVIKAPVPYHGRTSQVFHQNDALFSGIPSPFNVVRYHSLIVDPNSIPDALDVIANTESGLVMGVKHKELPKWGVQFHPESILTDFGIELIQNFHRLVHEHIGLDIKSEIGKKHYLANELKETDQPKKSKPTLQLVSKKISNIADPESMFYSMFSNEKYSFWLDSQNVGEDQARFSFMGAVDSDEVFTYHLSKDDTLFSNGNHYLEQLESMLGVFDVKGGDELPFEFRGGLIGFFSYEMRVLFSPDSYCSNHLPDAVWMKTHKFIAFDHLDKCCWAICIGHSENRQFLDRQLDQFESSIQVCKSSSLSKAYTPARNMQVHMAYSVEKYKAAIEKCRQAVIEGESYELCLTNKFSLKLDIDPFLLYCQMRKDNAAPFGAYIKAENFSVLSTSPERFLSVDSSRKVQTKPIKGTIARSTSMQQDELNIQTLRYSEKDQAENLMIVDLMRNDLRRVSVAGSVHVPSLMNIESYKTLHQMVSTVESRLRPECSLIDLLKATFPGGSISGAPKIRTMKILNVLEGFSRGVYCGSIGYLGYNGIADLNVAIRSLSYDGENIEFGAGGAITYLSDPEKEFDEIILKAEALLKPIWCAANGGLSEFNYHISHDGMSFHCSSLD